MPKRLGALSTVTALVLSGFVTGTASTAVSTDSVTASQQKGKKLSQQVKKPDLLAKLKLSSEERARLKQFNQDQLAETLSKKLGF